MRVLISGICVAGALLLTAASMFMNWSFWTGQGGDASSSQEEGVQTSIVVLFAILVELGSAFGLFLALLPMRGFAGWPRHSGLMQPRWYRPWRCSRSPVTDRRDSRGPLTAS